jgi:dCMP deaminase
MQLALTVRTRANCLGARVGAVLVLDNRVVSTGFNGTPAGFANCLDGGCERCKQRHYKDIGREDLITEPELASGPKQLDLCICVHAEANALLSAAKFGNRTEGATLYTTHKPCFSCVKEATQAGVERVVWLKDWEPSDRPSLKRQYEWLAEHLRRNDARNFEQLERQSTLLDAAAVEPRDPNLDPEIGPAPEEEEPAGAAAETSRKAAKASASSSASKGKTTGHKAASKPRRGPKRSPRRSKK